MAITIPAPDDATKQSLFPISRPAPAPDVFELGLVLGGTVAAGAYTAGALDCLLEVLERWYDGPRGHDVVVPMVAGASGGAICAGILGLLSRKKVPHIGGAYADLIASEAPTGNPLWDIWVNLVDGSQFLSSADIGNGPLLSLLDAGVIDQIAGHLVNSHKCWGTTHARTFRRPIAWR
jgi:hypothetical protein